MKRFFEWFSYVVLVLAIATAAYASIPAGNVHQIYSISGRNYYVESNDDLYKLAIVIYWEADDAATINIDTGDEVCANLGMDCVDTTIFDEASAGNEFTAALCDTDIDDGQPAFTYCN